LSVKKEKAAFLVISRIFLIFKMGVFHLEITTQRSKTIRSTFKTISLLQYNYKTFTHTYTYLTISAWSSFIKNKSKDKENVMALNKSSPFFSEIREGFMPEQKIVQNGAYLMLLKNVLSLHKSSIHLSLF